MKILYVSTISNTINRFLIPHIELLLDQGHQVDIACNIDREVDSYLIERGCNVYDIKFQRSPITKLNYVAYKKLKDLIKNGGYSIVHTHTPIASVCVRLACRNLKKVKVIYTAHGFHFFRGAPLINWLIYFPIEWYLARYTDEIITINKEDFNRAKKFFKGRVEYIPGVGFDANKYKEIVIDKQGKRIELGLPDNAFVVLSVGEINKNKNHETIIKAIANIKNPNIYYVLCGQGILEDYLKDMARELNIEKQVKLLGYRKDIAEICKVADVFAFPSYREGLGLAALEAMASGLPLVTSNVHGIIDYSINGVTGFISSPGDVDGFRKGIQELMINCDLRDKISKYNVDAVEKFNINNVLSEMKEIYKYIR